MPTEQPGPKAQSDIVKTIEVPRDVADMALRLAGVLYERSPALLDDQQHQELLAARFGPPGMAAVDGWRDSYRSFDWQSCRRQWAVVEPLINGVGEERPQ